MKNFVALGLTLPSPPVSTAEARSVSLTEAPRHRTPPPVMLRRVVEQRVARRGRALVLGGGTAASGLFLAQQGYEVIGVDGDGASIRAAQQEAREQGVPARFIEADVLAFRPEGTFELVFDSGCLQ